MQHPLHAGPRTSHTLRIPAPQIGGLEVLSHVTSAIVPPGHRKKRLLIDGNKVFLKKDFKKELFFMQVLLKIFQIYDITCLFEDITAS